MLPSFPDTSRQSDLVIFMSFFTLILPSLLIEFIYPLKLRILIQQSKDFSPLLTRFHCRLLGRYKAPSQASWQGKMWWEFQLYSLPPPFDCRSSALGNPVFGKKPGVNSQQNQVLSSCVSGKGSIWLENSNSITDICSRLQNRDGENQTSNGGEENTDLLIARVSF